MATTDAAHHAANLLKHYWQGDPRWQEFTGRMHQTATVIRQSKAAHLLAPKLRNKARFMSVGKFRLASAGCCWGSCRPAPPRAEVVQHYAWVAEFAVELAAWQEQHGAGANPAAAVVLVEGLHAASRAELEQRWQPLSVSTIRRRRRLRQRLAGYVACASRGLAGEERLLGSTEVLDGSRFGVQKRLEARDQVASGLTGLTLALGAVLGEHTAATVASDLEAVPQKVSEGWAKRWLGPTVQWLHRQLFSPSAPTAPMPATPVPNSG